MKQRLAISFLLIYFLALLNPIAPYINYGINKNEIIEEFCENKDKPQLNCEGKCHLTKQLAKVSEKSEQSQDNIKIDASYPIGSISFLKIKTIIAHKIVESIPSKKNYFINDFFGTIDHPPRYVLSYS